MAMKQIGLLGMIVFSFVTGVLWLGGHCVVADPTNAFAAF